jgi:hypothetical protein
MNASTSVVAPKGIEQLDSLKPDGKYPWYPNSEAGSSNPWQFSVGELYGCVCHTALDELTRSQRGSNLASGLKITKSRAQERKL